MACFPRESIGMDFFMVSTVVRRSRVEYKGCGLLTPYGCALLHLTQNEFRVMWFPFNPVNSTPPTPNPKPPSSKRPSLRPRP